MAQTKISQDDATPKGSKVALENSEILQGTSSANNQQDIVADEKQLDEGKDQDPADDQNPPEEEK